MGEFLRAELAAGQRYLPAGPNVLRAFTFPFDAGAGADRRARTRTRRRGMRSGLSFSVAADVRPLPRSLDNIFTEYSTDLGYPAPSNGDLTPWSERGVMLLNRVLTVRPGTPASHRGKGWEAVTECAIRALVARDRAAGGGAVGTRRGHAQADAAATRCDHRVGAPVAAVGVAGVLRVAAVQPRQRTAADPGAEPVDWRLP